MKRKNPVAKYAARFTRNKVHRDRKTLRWLAASGHGSRITLARQLAEARQFIRGGLMGVMV